MSAPKLQVTLTEVLSERRHDYAEIDTEDVPLKLGAHKLFEVITDTPRGRKMIRITAEVTRWPS